MKIYLAGKITNSNWRKELLIESGADENWVNQALGSEDRWECKEGVLLGGFDLTGPFCIAEEHISDYVPDNHGYILDREGSGVVGHLECFETRPKVLRLCQQAIQESDLIFAWIDTLDCYGTIAEIGYAKALEKTIAVAFDSKPTRYDDLWFIRQMADHLSVSNGSNVKGAYFQALYYLDLLDTPYSAQERYHASFSGSECFERGNRIGS